jgi:hypothetical protein
MYTLGLSDILRMNKKAICKNRENETNSRCDFFSESQTFPNLACLSLQMNQRFENPPDSTKTKALQTVIEMKDANISSTEHGL